MKNAIKQPALDSILRINIAQIYRRAIIMLVALIMGGVLFNETGLDRLVSELFADGINGFPLRNHWLAKGVLHDAAAKFSVVLAILLMGYNIAQWFKPIASIRTIISARYLMWSWLCATLAVAQLKSITKLPCPWNISEFGGNSEYIGLLNVFSSDYPVGHCFPSGHVTGGYGLIGLVFIAVLYGKPVRHGLLPVLLLGLLYGGAQMVRGAHFISHDLFSIGICLGSALLWARFYLFSKLPART